MPNQPFGKAYILIWFLLSDALESVEWKKLVDEHEEKLKALENKYQAKCEAAQVNISCTCLYLLLQTS